MTLGFAVGYLLDTLRRENQSFSAETPKDIGNTGVSESQNHEVHQFIPEQAEAAMQVSIDDSSDSAESLQQINGIGPAYARRLFENGIRSLAELAHTDVGTLANISKARSLAQVEGWVLQAAELLRK